LATRVLDSLIPHCRWHRIRVDADVPSDTAFRIQVASADNDDQPPHLLDWNSLPENASDQLIDEPPGRFLYVKIALHGTGEASPLIRRVRVDFPRVTSLEQLPAVYREDPDAEDFTERFLSLFDAAMEDLDAAIERFPALLDPAGVPEEVLPWLAAFLGVVFDPAWDAALRRRLLRAAPTLFAQRGTLAGIRNAIEMIFGVRPVIQERVLQRAWGALGADSRLGAVRLFGKSTARFRLGRSALNAASLRSYGNPDHDPLRSEAHRFTVLLPPAAIRDVDGVARLDRLIAQQKPAHTLHTVRVGGKGFIVGRTSVVGIDTQLLAPEPPVLGSAARPREMPGNTRLSRTSILRPGVNVPARSVGVGNALVGLNTVLE
jgi:phage tail-like protein